MINKSKDGRQQIGIDKFRQSSIYGSSANGRGVWQYPTGFGKTTGTIKLLKAMLEKRPNLTFIVLVHRDALRDQWEAILKKEITSSECNYAVYTPNQIIQDLEYFTTDFLIADELHRYYGKSYIDCINGTKIKFKWNLGLSATPIDRDNVYKSISYLWPIIDRITEREALDNNWISEYVEYNLGLELPQDEAQKYLKYSDTISKHHNKFGKDSIKLASRCAMGGVDSQGKYFTPMTWATVVAESNGWHPNLNLDNEVEAEIDNLWNPNKVRNYATRYMDSIRARKELLYNSPVKKEYVLQLLQRFKEVKIVCFSQSTTFAENIADAYNAMTSTRQAVVYHSDLASRPLQDDDGGWILYKSGAKKGQRKIFGKKLLKKDAIEGMKKSKYRILSTASALDDGLDIPDLQIGITSSGTSNFIQHAQRSGRVKRLDESIQNGVLLINLYFKDTKDYDWLLQRQKGSTNPIYWVDSIEMIEFEGTLSVKPTTPRQGSFFITK